VTTIVELRAENFKRLKAVHIEPSPEGLVVIAGRNAQGKSSVLDAIWAAVAGKAGAVERPVRDGETGSEVEIDFGQFRVRKTWTASGKATLKVTSAEGAEYPSPQKVLDQLLGELSFDPLAFANAPSRDQLATLLSVVDLPFDPAELEAQRKALYDERTAANREVKRVQGVYDSLPRPPKDLPAREIDVAELARELSAAQNDLREMDRFRREHEIITQKVGGLRRELALAEAELVDITAAGRKLSAKMEGAPSVAQIQTRLDAAEGVNAQVRKAAERERAREELATARAESERLTNALKSLDTRKAQALERAALPVAGLGFEEDGVTFNGVPFSQASGAERLKVSVAMAMALNPNIKVIRITDGSLLDSENLAVIEEMASAHGFQVWIERVDETGETGVIIEDGEVK
jgi:energy-coupling factor transporter ATP-binding protein EcfA2